MSGSGAFDASTPAEAQMKPWRRLGDHERLPNAHDARRLSEDRPRCGAGPVVARDLHAALRRLHVGERTTRPSDFETIFCARTTTSPSSSSTFGDDQLGEVVPCLDLRQTGDGMMRSSRLRADP